VRLCLAVAVCIPHADTIAQDPQLTLNGEVSAFLYRAANSQRWTTSVTQDAAGVSINGAEGHGLYEVTPAAMTLGFPSQAHFRIFDRKLVAWCRRRTEPGRLSDAGRLPD